jgi:hypothetical protein
MRFIQHLRLHQMLNSINHVIKGKKIDDFIKIHNTRPGRCLYPLDDCLNEPIKAHSIQNARAFELLQENNHLIQIRSRFDKTIGPTPEFCSIGRNEASTFLGLCAVHDAELFRIIDANALDPESPQHMFLLAYRSILKEFHAVVSSFIKIQTSYLKQFKDGLIPGEDESKDMLPIEWLAKAYDTHTYKEPFDIALRGQNFAFVRHKYVVLDKQRPTVACSQLFSADSIAIEDDVLRVILNVFPINLNQTLVVFSSSAREFPDMINYAQRCWTGDDNFVKYEISKMIIRNCENFFINPAAFRTWTSEKTHAIREFYLKSMRGDIDLDHADYYLF